MAGLPVDGLISPYPRAKCFNSIVLGCNVSNVDSAMALVPSPIATRPAIAMLLKSFMICSLVFDMQFILHVYCSGIEWDLEGHF